MHTLGTKHQAPSQPSQHSQAAIIQMYPWGKKNFPETLLGPIFLGAGTTAGLVLFAGSDFVNSGGPAMDADSGSIDFRKLKGVMMATLGLAYLIESGLGVQVFVNNGRKSKPSPEEAQCAYRGVYNSLEHVIPALIFIWLHAILVNSNTATLLGCTYAVSRFAYTFLMGLFGGFSIAVEPCTEFCYSLLSLLLIGIIGELLGKGDVLASAAGQLYYAAPLGFGALVFWWMGVWLPVGAPGSKVIIKGVAWKEAAMKKQ
jgi:hypothetical protein